LGRIEAQIRQVTRQDGGDEAADQWGLQAGHKQKLAIEGIGLLRAELSGISGDIRAAIQVAARRREGVRNSASAKSACAKLWPRTSG